MLSPEILYRSEIQTTIRRACFFLHLHYYTAMALESINARIPAGLKRAMKQYCDERGLKVQAFIEDLIQEHLEDEMDLRLIDERRDEETLPFEDVIREIDLEM